MSCDLIGTFERHMRAVWGVDINRDASEAGVGLGKAHAAAQAPRQELLSQRRQPPRYYVQRESMRGRRPPRSKRDKDFCQTCMTFSNLNTYLFPFY